MYWEYFLKLPMINWIWGSCHVMEGCLEFIYSINVVLKHQFVTNIEFPLIAVLYVLYHGNMVWGMCTLCIINGGGGNVCLNSWEYKMINYHRTCGYFYQCYRTLTVILSWQNQASNWAKAPKAQVPLSACPELCLLSWTIFSYLCSWTIFSCLFSAFKITKIVLPLKKKKKNLEVVGPDTFSVTYHT